MLRRSYTNTARQQLLLSCIHSTTHSYNVASDLIQEPHVQSSVKQLTSRFHLNSYPLKFTSPIMSHQPTTPSPSIRMPKRNKGRTLNRADFDCIYSEARRTLIQSGTFCQRRMDVEVTRRIKHMTVLPGVCPSDPRVLKMRRDNVKYFIESVKDRAVDVMLYREFCATDAWKHHMREMEAQEEAERKKGNTVGPSKRAFSKLNASALRSGFSCESVSKARDPLLGRLAPTIRDESDIPILCLSGEVGEKGSQANIDLKPNSPECMTKEHWDVYPLNKDGLMISPRIRRTTARSRELLRKALTRTVLPAVGKLSENDCFTISNPGVQVENAVIKS